MSQNILIVDSSSPSSADSQGLGRVLSELENARRITWDSFAPRQLRDAQHCLMIANALDRGDHATAFFRWLRDNPVPLPILAILPGAVLPGDDSSLLCAAIETVDDFLLSPVRPEELKQRIARFLGPRGKDLAAVQTALTAEIGLGLLVGQDPAFLRVMEQIALFGTNDAPVLLTGETGTGKELSARVTHLLSKRHAGPFIPVDCGGIPDHLFENELFGHARGAFTDARSDQKGLVALAQGGTLFLDEIDSLSLAAQSKVLRLLQEHTYRPLGSEVFKRADVRIVTATNRDLHQLVEQKLFRSDLYFRIHVLHIHLPALRDRPTDIELLTRHFIDDICAASNLPRKVLSQAAARKLRQHDWPGNVRELYNTMQRAVLCSPGAQVAAVTINLHGSSSAPLDDMCEILSEKFRSAKLRAIQCFERDYVRQMMDKHAGNVTQAAREAGKDRRAFGRLAKKYGFPGASA